MIYRLFNPPNFRRRTANINHRERKKTNHLNTVRAQCGLPLCAIGIITPDDLMRITGKAQWQCEWCGKLHSNPHIDHIVPGCLGGENVVENLAVSCPSCNRRKSQKHPTRWAHEIYGETGKMTPLIQWLVKEHKLELVWQMSLDDSTGNESDADLGKAA